MRSIIVDEPYALRATLADILDGDNIEAVMRFRLLAEYDPDRRPAVCAEIPADTDRARELIRAWLRKPAGAIQ